MSILGKYSFADGEKYINKNFLGLLKEVEEAIGKVDASICLTKESKEKTMVGRMLYSPVALNEEFKKHLNPLGWKNVKERCEYSTHYYVNNYKPEEKKIYPYRDMDFVKGKLGVEVQFGKYAFMVYNSKMTPYEPKASN